MGVSTKPVPVETKITIEDEKNSQDSGTDNKSNDLVDDKNVNANNPA